MSDRWAPREGRGRDRDRSRSPRRGRDSDSRAAKSFEFMVPKNALFDERESGSFETFERGAKRRESPERWGHDKFKKHGDDDDDGEDALAVWERERKERIRKLKQEGGFRGGRYDKYKDRGDRFSSKDRRGGDRRSPDRRRRWDNNDRDRDRPRSGKFDGNTIPVSEEERGKREKRAGRFRRSRSSSSSRSASPKRSSAIVRDNNNSEKAPSTDGQPTPSSSATQEQTQQPEASSS